MKATIIGAGNIGLALAAGLVESGACKSSEITLTRRNTKSLVDWQKKGFRLESDNKLGIVGADTIFVCVLPQQLNDVLEEIKADINTKKQLIVSVVTGAHTSV